MFGPGEYVPDPTEGIVDVKDLPTPQLVAYSRNHKHTPCPRCGHLAYRHKSDQRTLHDLVVHPFSFDMFGSLCDTSLRIGT
jgi:hypothetical protein